MPSEITAFIMPQTQTIQSIDISPDQENIEPGLFDAFISEYILTEENDAAENEIDPNAIPNAMMDMDIQPDTENNVIAFTGNNSFSRSVIDILADLKEDIPAKINDDVKVIVSKIKSIVSELPKELKEIEEIQDIQDVISNVIKDDSIPEDTKQEIMNAINDLVNELKDSSFESVKSFAVKVSDIIHAVKVDKPEIEIDTEDKDDDTKSADDIEVPEETDTTKFTNMAMIANVNPQVPETAIETQTQTGIPESTQQAVIDHPIQRKTKTHTVNLKPQAEVKSESESEVETEPATQETRAANFNEHLEHADAESETPNQNQSQSQNQNAGQEENQNEQPNATQATSRTTRRTSAASSTSTTSRTQNERTESNSNRTESRNTFQSFFEGVLSTRRNASQSSPLPLNLQTSSYTLNQSQTLRDGMINIIRFIRADGVQKANVVIDPPALGRITVELSSTSSGVEASIKVASEQIRQLVQDQISELRMNLSQQGVQVAEFTVDVQQDNSNSNGNNQGNQYNEPRTYAINEADEEGEEFRIDLEDGLLYWIA